MSKFKLICLPYAGGSSTIYNSWPKYLHNTIELERLELSGRGTRSSEALYQTMDDAVNDIYMLIKDSINELPYILFGHSMGSILTYELAHKIKESELKNPIHIIFSGSNAPHINNKREHCHRLSDDKFKEAMLEYGATPVEVFENKMIANYFIPILRSDFKILETYNHKNKNSKLDCPISVFFSKTDRFVDEKFIDSWSQYTNNKFNSYVFNGDHFFINSNKEDVISTINNIVAQI